MELDKYVDEVDDLLDEILPILEHYRQDNRSNGLVWIQIGDLIRRIDVLYKTVPNNDRIIEELQEEIEDLKKEISTLEDTVEEYKEAISDIKHIIDGI